MAEEVGYDSKSCSVLYGIHGTILSGITGMVRAWGDSLWHGKP